MSFDFAQTSQDFNAVYGSADPAQPPLVHAIAQCLQTLMVKVNELTYAVNHHAWATDVSLHALDNFGGIWDQLQSSLGDANKGIETLSTDVTSFKHRIDYLGVELANNDTLIKGTVTSLAESIDSRLKGASVQDAPAEAHKAAGFETATKLAQQHAEQLGQHARALQSGGPRLLEELRTIGPGVAYWRGAGKRRILTVPPTPWEPPPGPSK